MKFRDYIGEEKYRVPMIKREKFKKLNPKTNRMKTSRKTRYLDTKIPPNKRTFKNLPKYADGKPKVRFQDWLMIKVEKGNSFGKSEADGKTWWGWSHRAVAGFKPGDKITKNTIGSGGKEFTIKSNKKAREMAIKFARGVA